MSIEELRSEKNIPKNPLFLKNDKFNKYIIDESINLSLELVIETLVSCGLRRIDAEVYAFLAKNGPHTGKDLAITLKLTKQELYHSIKLLKEKEIVKSISKRPARFSAEPIEKVLTTFIESRKKEIQNLKQKKQNFIKKRT